MLAPTSPPAAPGTGRPATRLRLLYVGTLHHSSAWLREALAREPSFRVELREAVGATAALAELREQPCDAVLLTHQPGVLDGLGLAESLRLAGHSEPLLVLGTQHPTEVEADALEPGADAYLCLALTTTRSLLWALARAQERWELQRENRRLLQAQQQRLAAEHSEAQRLLDQQRSLVEDLEQLRLRDEQQPTESVPVFARSAESTWPTSPERQYRELLQAYVVMGSGNLARPLAELADQLAANGQSPAEALEMHTRVVEGVVAGLGNRSARHVLTRADLLLVELLVHLAEGYRQRYHRVRHPAQQQWLPGFDDDFAPAQKSAA